MKMKKYIIPIVEMEEKVVSCSFIMTSPAPLTPANGPGQPGLHAPERKPY